VRAAAAFIESVARLECGLPPLLVLSWPICEREHNPESARHGRHPLICAMLLTPNLTPTWRILRSEGVFEQALVVPAGTTAIDACVGIHRRVARLVPEKLPDAFKGAGLRIKQNFGAQVPELVWGQHDAGPPLRIG
jgi:hypothetical protein